MSSNWWANKLGAAPAPAQRQPVPQAPVQQPVYPQTPNYPPVQHSPQQAVTCPGCGSGNYSGAAGTRPRCYDCGYPIQQSGSGVGKGIVSGPQASGPVQASIQVPTGGWNPTTIIGKLE